MRWELIHARPSYHMPRDHHSRDASEMLAAAKILPWLSYPLHPLRSHGLVHRLTRSGLVLATHSGWRTKFQKGDAFRVTHRCVISLPLQFTMLRTYFNATMTFLREEDGPTAVEYAVVLSLIIGLCIASVNQLATVVGNSFQTSGTAINNSIGN